MTGRHYGLDYHETRFSKLNQITTSNVKELGLMWTYNLESSAASRPRRSLSTASCMSPPRGRSCTRSIRAPARRLWTFDPETPREGGYKGCCDVVNRGVALYKGKVYVGAYDGG